jgi:hypothetical protein
MKNMGVIASPCHAVLTVASIDGILPKPFRTFPNGEQAQGAYTVSTTDWIWFDAGCQLLAEVPGAFRADVQILGSVLIRTLPDFAFLRSREESRPVNEWFPVAEPLVPQRRGLQKRPALLLKDLQGPRVQAAAENLPRMMRTLRI